MVSADIGAIKAGNERKVLPPEGDMRGAKVNAMIKLNGPKFLDYG